MKNKKIIKTKVNLKDIYERVRKCKRCKKMYGTDHKVDSGFCHTCTSKVFARGIIK